MREKTSKLYTYKYSLARELLQLSEKKQTKMVTQSIPTVDLSPFCHENGSDEAVKKRAIEEVGRACSEYGFFQVVNHGVPLGLLARALELSQLFFDYPLEEKLKASPIPGAPLSLGYTKQIEHLTDNNEYILMFTPESSFNVYPENPPEYREVLREMFPHFKKIALIVESIISQCLGLPPNFLRDYNNIRTWDVMAALHYTPATDGDDNVSGQSEHKDSNCISFVYQDDVGGLEVNKDGKWIPITPNEGTLVVNIGDVIQVLSNDKFKSATHRVVRPIGKSRNSYAFFYNVDGEKWVEPLPQFTEAVGEPPKYRGFFYKEYALLRLKNREEPPARVEDMINLNYYAIPTLKNG
ncbi:hypothetical protein CsSME_00053545 [Camellia sinensis var. sinensis]